MSLCVVYLLMLCLYVVILFGALYVASSFFFFQAEDGIRDLVRSRGLGDVYKRQGGDNGVPMVFGIPDANETKILMDISRKLTEQVNILSLIHI